MDAYVPDDVRSANRQLSIRRHVQYARDSGDGADTLVSPKFGAVLAPWFGTELHVNAGLGFHSNDARGAVIRVDPITGTPAEPVRPLVRAKGGEVGIRTVHLRGLQSTASLWYSVSTLNCS
jgi:hypothetical protein